jgi:hypothetical protein
MESVILIAILAGALAVLARIVWRTFAARDGSKPPTCAGCPFDSKCAMQHREHLESCGDGSGNDD